jgi:hypothetical protein
MTDFQDLDIESELAEEFSKAQVMKIASYIGTDEQRFSILMNIFLKGHYNKAQMALWVFAGCTDKYPLLTIPYFRNLIQRIQEPGVSDSVKRHIIKVWQYIEIPEEYIGELYDICFGFLNANAATVIKIYSMYVCCNIVKKIPELKTEFRLTIEDLLLKNQDGSGAIRSSTRKILKDLKKK